MMARTESQKERYLFLKEHKICVFCGQENAAPHSVLCVECREKMRYYNRIRDKKEKREKNKICRRKIRAERISKVLCPCCGKEKPAEYRYSLCPSCRAKYRKYDEKRRRARGAIGQQERRYLGICRQCDKPVVDGYCYCKEHLEKARRSAQIATEKRLAITSWQNKKEELFAWTFLKRYSCNG